MKAEHLFTGKVAELFPGVSLRFFAGDKLSVSYVQFEPGAIGTTHEHPHEQITLVLQGELEMHIGEESCVLKAGEIVAIPSNTLHGARAISAVEAVEFFTPVREDLQAKFA